MLSSTHSTFVTRLWCAKLLCHTFTFTFLAVTHVVLVEICILIIILKVFKFVNLRILYSLGISPYARLFVYLNIYIFMLLDLLAMFRPRTITNCPGVIPVLELSGGWGG